jgi:hypothetical protein
MHHAGDKERELMKISGPSSPCELPRAVCKKIQRIFLRCIQSIAPCAAVVATSFAAHCCAMGPGPFACRDDIARFTPSATTPSVCSDPLADPQVKRALGWACLQRPAKERLPMAQKTIVIGFLGGFARPSDVNHPEIWFDRYLRERYTSAIYTGVFANHHANAALNYVLGLLDTDCDGRLTESEKQSARIILYGHSWGASEVAAFAGELGKLGIPVLLTVQIDIIPKPGQSSTEIPSNVEQAVNFYQSIGLLRGQSRIVAANPARTKIIGNYWMNYRNHSIDCGNFPWFARTFNKPHHEIENDTQVWQRINSLVDSDLSIENRNRYETASAGH